jgi:hypothetical protein
MGGGLALAVLTAFLAGRVRFLANAAAWFADRVTVFLFLFIPASLISIVVVLVRNLF